MVAPLQTGARRVRQQLFGLVSWRCAAAWSR